MIINLIVPLLAALIPRLNAQYSPEFANFVDLAENITFVSGVEIDVLRETVYVVGQADVLRGKAAIAAYDYFGFARWIKFVGTGEGEAFDGVAIDKETGDVYASGVTAPFTGFDDQEPVGFINNFVTKFDSNGTKIWTRIFGSAGADLNYNIHYDDWRHNLVVVSFDSDRGALTWFDNDGNMLNRITNSSLTKADMERYPDLERFDYKSLLVTEDVIYVVGNVQTYYYYSTIAFVMAIDPVDYSILWKVDLDEDAYAIAYDLSINPDEGVLYVVGTTSSNFLDTYYDYDAGTGSNGFCLSFDIETKTPVWVRQWDRGLARTNMAATSVKFAKTNLIYLVEYALARGPAFISTFNLNGTVQQSLQIRYNGWQFVNTGGIVIDEAKGFGFVAGSYGRNLPNIGYLVIFNVNDTLSSKKQVVDFGKWYATTRPLGQAPSPVTLYETDFSNATSRRLLRSTVAQNSDAVREPVTISGGAIAGIVIGNLFILVGMVVAVFLVGRYYHVKKLKEQMAQRREMMMKLQEAQMEAGVAPTGGQNIAGDVVQSGGMNVGSAESSSPIKDA